MLLVVLVYLKGNVGKMQNTEMLKKNYEFRKVLTKGKYYKSKYIEVFAIKNNLKINKLGIAIGVKLGKAFQRNYVKRLIRENYRKIENQLCVGYNIIFLWNKKINISEADYYKIENDLKNIFNKMEIFK